MSEESAAKTKHIAEEILQLLKLQERDVKISRLKEELEAKPREKAGLQEQLTGQKKRLEEAKENYKKLLAERNSLEVELESKIQNVYKLEAQSSQVKTNEEYRAMLKEIDQLKQANRSLEDKILEAMEKGEEAKKVQSGEEAALKQQEGQVAGRQSQIDEEIKGIQALLEGLQKEKEQLLSSVRPQVLERYNRIFENKGDFAVVTIEHGACGGCHMAITPQLMNEVKRGQELILCENCARILFLPQG